MAHLLRKLDDGREVKGLELQDPEVKSVGDYEIEIVGSTAHKDRQGESIEPEGFDLKNYKKNPIVLPAHDYHQPAIGRATNVKIKDGQLVFKIEFPQEGVNPLADVYRKLYKGGFMNASSVGFLPVEWRDGDGKGKDPYRTYTKVELLEISLVSVPANPNALLSAKGVEQAVQKGVLTGEDVKTIQQYAKKALEGGDNVKECAKPCDSQATGDVEPAVESKEEVKAEPAGAGDAGDPDDDADANAVKDDEDIAKIYNHIAELRAMVEALSKEIEDLKVKDCVSRHYLDVDDGSAVSRPKIGKTEVLNLAKDVFA